MKINAPASVVFLTFILALTAVVPAQPNPQPQKPKKTEVASDKYGPGGKHITYSYDNLKLVSEEWVDNENHTRESITYDGNEIKTHKWVLYHDGNPVSLNSELDDYPVWELQVKEPGKPVRMVYDTREDIEKYVAEIREQFEKDGTIPPPKKKTDTAKQKEGKTEGGPNKPKTDQPSIDPDKLSPLSADVFNPDSPKDKNNEPKKEEPKKTEQPKEAPKKEEPPKTDKTSTGESGGNTASTSPKSRTGL